MIHLVVFTGAILLLHLHGCSSEEMARCSAQVEAELNVLEDEFANACYSASQYCSEECRQIDQRLYAAFPPDCCSYDADMQEWLCREDVRSDYKFYCQGFDLASPICARSVSKECLDPGSCALPHCRKMINEIMTWRSSTDCQVYDEQDDRYKTRDALGVKLRNIQCL